MKIGILTYHHPENRNYGAMLQLFALYSTIESLGHRPYVIQYEFNKDRKKKFKQKIKFGIIYELAIKPFAQFSQEYIPNKTFEVNDSDIHKLNHDLDVFIVGSDQVWRYDFVPNIKTFFLDFVDDSKPKISYAASFGLDTWNDVPPEVTKQVIDLLGRFDAVSVREHSGVNICKDFCIDACVVLDPVLLLSSEQYIDLIPGIKKTHGSRYISYMILDETTEINNLITSFAQSIQAKKVCLKGINYPIIGKIATKKYRINKWLQLIRNSQFVITDSFHCVAFCIIFQKQFVCVPNKTRGMTRLESLLGMLGLKNRLLYHIDLKNLNSIAAHKIDFNSTSEKIEEMKNNSMHFLKRSLNKFAKN